MIRLESYNIVDISIIQGYYAKIA